jgi:hypothetical protein
MLNGKVIIMTTAEKKLQVSTGKESTLIQKNLIKRNKDEWK